MSVAPLVPPVASTLDPRLAQVLEYWLGAEMPTDASALSRQALWFQPSEDIDEEIRRRFGNLLLETLAGKLNDEAQMPLGWLAQIIVLDQFTRNAYRGTAKAFAGDAQALQLVRHGINQCFDIHEDIPSVARIFIYLPLEHAEDLVLQAQSVVAFEQLAQEATPQTQQFFTAALDYAIRHQQVIERFGRFPHRNVLLGRASTHEEQQYLSQPCAGF